MTFDFSFFNYYEISPQKVSQIKTRLYVVAGNYSTVSLTSQVNLYRCLIRLKSFRCKASPLISSGPRFIVRFHFCLCFREHPVRCAPPKYLYWCDFCKKRRDRLDAIFKLANNCCKLIFSFPSYFGLKLNYIDNKALMSHDKQNHYKSNVKRTKPTLQKVRHSFVKLKIIIP